ncbi:MAG: hypothetical protein KA143_10810 [Saprospiraceae bacterium]|nr:hypothetical protein [Saprospiraceae bacterium]
MKNKMGKTAGFIAGTGGFLLFFKILFLEKVSPHDELAPGFVILIATVIGILVSYAGGQIQGMITKHQIKSS